MHAQPGFFSVLVKDPSMNSPSKKGKFSPSGDQRFKEIVHDRDILASIIKGVIPEFENLSREEIYGYLDIKDDGHTVRGRDIELVSSVNGPIYMDSVFDVRSPNEGEMSIIVAIEGQGSQMSPNDLSNRQIYYSSRLISDQGQDFPTKDSLYRNLRKTTVVWVKISPVRAERNTIIRDNRYRYSVAEPDRIYRSPLDKTEIIEVNVGPYDEGEKIELLGILGILFSREMDERAKNHNLKEKYHISLRSSIIKEAGHMGALAEEYELYGNERERIGLEKGREEGLVKGREEGLVKGREEESKDNIDYYTALVLKRCAESGEPLEQIVDSMTMPPKYRESVFERARKELSEGDS